jgi:AraC-like DNA-binding protein
MENTLYIKDNMDSPNYEVFYKDNIPSVDHPLHYHDFLEIYYHAEGDCDYIIDSRIYTLKHGDIVLINNQRLHRAVIKDMTKPYRRFVLWLEYNYLEALLGGKIEYNTMIGKESRTEIFRLPGQQSEEIELIFRKMCRESEVMDFASSYLQESYLSQLLLLFCRYSQNSQSVEETTFENDEMIQSIMDYIDQHYMEPITLDMIAQHFFMNKYHLMRKFKKHTRMTIMDYCKKRRLIIARNYLMEGARIQDIYKLSGFDDYSNFFRAFKSAYQMSPRDYKNYMIQSHNSTIQLAVDRDQINKKH